MMASSLAASKAMSVSKESNEPLQYEVLYYKRTNKVHKSKGVSKADGTLTVLPPPSCHVTLKDAAVVLESDSSNDNSEDDEEEAMTWKQRNKKKRKTTVASKNRGIVFSGIHREIANRTLSEDDVVALGSFEVQILSLCNRPNKEVNPESGENDNSIRRTTTTIGPNKLQPVRKKMVPLKRKAIPLQSKKVAPTNTQTSSFTAKQEGSTARAPVRSLTQRRPLQSKSLLVAKNAANSKHGSSISAIGTKKRPLNSPKPAESPLGSPVTVASSVLSHIPLPASIRPVLRPHQVTGVDFLWQTLTMSQHHGAILADEMGLGKTLMTIAVICGLHRRHRSKQFVVVCPSSLVSNWGKEFDKWIGGASQPKRVVIKKGGEAGLQQIRAYCSTMKQQLSNPIGQVLIISYELFRMNVGQFQEINKNAVGLLVVDEGHRLKNTAGSLTLTALESLKSDARLCITATPIQNNLSEFYNLVNFVCPGMLGDLATFRRDYERPIAAANSKTASHDERARGKCQSQALDSITKTFMLRRLQKDILKTMLPPRTEALLFCRPSEEQCELYRSITQDTNLNGSQADALNTLASLRKICSHPFLYKGEQEKADDNVARSQSGKLIVLEALLKNIRKAAPDDKVVIVSNFTSALSLIESLVLEPRQLSYLRLDGTTELQHRQTLVDTFNRSSTERNFCFLLSSKAGGCGLNLVGANRLIMFDPEWNPALDRQAMGRVYRQGQTKPCFIYRLFTAGTVEEVIYQRQSQKGNLVTLTVDGNSGKSSKGHFTKEELADCFTLKEACTCETKNKIGSQWPDYNGPDSLRSQGCLDEPLLSVSENLSGTLGHVHIVDEDEMVDVEDVQSEGAGERESTCDEAGYDTDSNDELEF